MFIFHFPYNYSSGHRTVWDMRNILLDEVSYDTAKINEHIYLVIVWCVYIYLNDLCVFFLFSDYARRPKKVFIQLVSKGQFFSLCQYQQPTFQNKYKDLQYVSCKTSVKNRQKIRKIKSLSCLLCEILLTKDDITWQLWQNAIFLPFGDTCKSCTSYRTKPYLFIIQ